MPLAEGTRLGPYEVLGPAGSGGMGEVYRARDTRLDRVVALKILPPHLASNLDALERFEREARAISRFTHAHICALYDVGHGQGASYLVLEYLEGETLASRLARGPLPFLDTLRIGRQVAAALQAAHRLGIVHRDLKPGNIMLTKSGAKLLDFGLAKPMAREKPDVGAPSVSPTASRRLTSEGTVVGTIQYMAPEQLEGLDTDLRTDIFALGLVLYEMIAGQHPFERRTEASLIAAVLKEEPRPLSEIDPGVPRAFERVVRTCLEKEPEHRWQSAQDVQLQLGWLERHGDESGSAPKLVRKVGSRERILWAASVLLLMFAGSFAFNNFRRTTEVPPLVRASLMPPPGSSFEPNHFAISPDGTRLAFVAVDSAKRMWVRTLSGSGAQPLIGTEGAMLPFWAPDSRRIGFFTTGGKLKTVDLVTGSVQELCDAPYGRGGAWNRDDLILFSPTVAGSILRISAGGGTPVEGTRVPAGDRGQAHRWPFFLEDGRHFLFFVDWSSPGNTLENGIYVGSLDSSEPKLVLSDVTGNVAFASGHLLFVRDGRLMAQPFDSTEFVTTGPMIPLSERELEKDQAHSFAAFSVSENGMLVLQSAVDSRTRLKWFSVEGEEMGEIPAERFRDPQISPNGRLLAVSSDDSGDGTRFIRVYDLERGVSTRLSDSGGDEFPIWSRDGARIAYVSTRGNSFSLVNVPADGSGQPRVLTQGGKMIPNDWSPDGKLVFMSFEKGPSELAVLSPTDGRTMAFDSGGEAQLSPDGNWIAFLSRGRLHAEIVVQPFPGPGARIQISNGGGAQPRWSHDGRTIYYIAPDRKLMAVSFDSRSVSAGPPRVLFETRITSPSFAVFQYAVAPDGRFLINSLPSENASPLTLLTRWPELLTR